MRWLIDVVRHPTSAWKAWIQVPLLAALLAAHAAGGTGVPAIDAAASAEAITALAVNLLLTLLSPRNRPS